jgi:pimeloyl-ACP methyl ester carboxylesterase
MVIRVWTRRQDGRSACPGGAAYGAVTYVVSAGMTRTAPAEPPPIPGVRRSRVTARGVDFHVTEAGPEDGQPVICLHGWPQHHYEWRALLEDPPPGLRIIAPDLPGYGWSGPPPHDWHKEEVANDVLALMDGMEIAKAVLVAHDWGGYVGYYMTLNAPGRLSAYLCLNMAHVWQTPRSYGPHVWRSLTYMPLVAFAGIPLMTRTDLIFPILRYQYVPRTWPWPTSVSDEELRWFADRCRDPTVARSGRDTYRTFLTQELPHLRTHPEQRISHVPTRAVFGLRDFAVHRDLASEKTARCVDYTLELVPNVGHFISDERPDIVRDRLISLVGQFPPS